MCKGKFLAYMGSDDEEEESEPLDPPTSSSKVITADLSHMYSMDGRPRAATLEFHGFLITSEVFILVDTGSTHNFVHPRIAEKVKLPLTAIRPFRVYVGNGQSLTCSYTSAQAELRIQGHSSVLDLYVLLVHGPDVILGMAWLHSLHRVTSDYNAGTVEFQSNGRPVCLKVTPRMPRQISVHTFASILFHQEAVDIFEIVLLPDSTPETNDKLELSSDLPPTVRDVLQQHAAVFTVSLGLLPSRAFDHKIHLLPHSKPVNVLISRRMRSSDKFERCSIMGLFAVVAVPFLHLCSSFERKMAHSFFLLIIGC